MPFCVKFFLITRKMDNYSDLRNFFCSRHRAIPVGVWLTLENKECIWTAKCTGGKLHRFSTVSFLQLKVPKFNLFQRKQKHFPEYENRHYIYSAPPCKKYNIICPCICVSRADYRKNLMAFQWLTFFLPRISVNIDSWYSRPKGLLNQSARRKNLIWL